MPKNSKNRLSKRQAGYNAAIRNISGLSDSRDEFSNDRNDYINKLRLLNQKIAELSPYDANGKLIRKDDNKIKKLSKDDIEGLMTLYKDATNAMHKYTKGISLAIDKKAKVKGFAKKRKKLEKIIALNDTIAKTLGKDLRVLTQASKRDVDISLNTIFENSRLNSDYTLVSEVSEKRDKGNQNERIPMTIRDKDGNEIKGYFTYDNKPKINKSYVKKALENTKAKYGKAADFIKVNDILDFYEDLLDADNPYTDIGLIVDLMGNNVKYTMTDYDKCCEHLIKKGGKSIKKFIDTPAKLNIFLDLCSECFSANNQLAIAKGIGINQDSRVNRRNAAMSKIAELLGCQDVLADSENIKIKINGKTAKGTFMRQAHGDDINKIKADSMILKSSPVSSYNLNIKKQAAALQVLDYLCGNPDRHGGNMLYNFEEKDGEVLMTSIQGIDNDSSFGSNEYTKVGLKPVVTLDNIKVIPKDVSDRLLSLDEESLTQVLYGFDLTTKEVNGVIKRLGELQSTIRKDAKVYEDGGYTKGYILPENIKIVDDEELDQIQINQLRVKLAGKKNIFNRIDDACSSYEAYRAYVGNLKNKYENDVYDLTLGNVDKMNKLISKLDKDTRWGGSSEAYDQMHDEMKELNELLVSFHGEISNNILNEKHAQIVEDIREKMTKTLISVNNYIVYKGQKKHGEEWRNIKGPHEASRTERRYHDAMECRAFLNEQLDKFFVLDGTLKELVKINKGKKKILNDCLKNDEKAKQRNLAIEASQIQNQNLYINHVARTKKEIIKAYNDYKMDSNNEINRADFERKLGFAINGIKDSERNSFRNEMKEMMGVENLPSDDELIKKAIACDMVLTKHQLMEKTKKNEDLSMEEMTLFGKLNSVNVQPIKDSVNQLYNSKVFNEFYKEAKEDEKLHFSYIYKEPGVSFPDFNDKNNLFRVFSIVSDRMENEMNLEEVQAQENKNINKKTDKKKTEDKKLENKADNKTVVSKKNISKKTESKKSESKKSEIKKSESKKKIGL
ncbi:MAG: hypothetical protein K6E10_11870 [Eubacterium sp.]|nr:hypothetical protein [Eubacterium sp.]